MRRLLFNTNEYCESVRCDALIVQGALRKRLDRRHPYTCTTPHHTTTQLIQPINLTTQLAYTFFFFRFHSLRLLSFFLPPIILDSLVSLNFLIVQFTPINYGFLSRFYFSIVCTIKFIHYNYIHSPRPPQPLFHTLRCKVEL